MHNNFLISANNAPLNGIGRGPSLLTPYAYFGNSFGRITELRHSNPNSKNWGKSTVAKDEGAQIGLEQSCLEDPPEEQDNRPWALEDFNQCLKRYQVEVNWFKNSNAFPEEGSERVGRRVNPRALEELMWNLDAKRRMQGNMLLDFDTLDLYEPGGDVGNIGRRVDDPKHFIKCPMVARGLPIKLQKVYFYGTKGDIKNQGPSSKTRAMGNSYMSDGRGTLFSTYILTCAAPVNVLRDNYLHNSLMAYTSFQGGEFSFSSHRYASQKDQFNEGLDVEWDPLGEEQDSPLIIGDGALGFREQTFSEIFEKNDIFYVNNVDAYYKQTVTLCIDDPEGGSDKITVNGSILFQPDAEDDHYFSASNKRMVIHDIKNLFSEKSIVPPVAGEAIGPLPDRWYQKRGMLQRTDLLWRVEP